MLSKFLRPASFCFKRSSIAKRFINADGASLDGYGQHLFKGAVAAPYLEKHGLAKNTLEEMNWPKDGNADKVK